MYPLSLEQQHQKFFIGEFRKIALPFTSAIIKRLKTEIKADSDYSIRADSVTQMLIFLSQLKEEYGDKIDTTILESKIKKNFALIDAWSRDKTNEAIARMYSRLNTPQPSTVTERPTPEKKMGELWMQVINLRQSLNEGMIDDVVKLNVSLIDDAFKSYFADIENIIKNGISSGKGHRAIADLLMDQFGISENRAKFWARDQGSKFFGDTTRLRQKGAGIKGYIWRCTGGRKTRDTHRALEGTYHDWNEPPMVGGRRLHPGQDYNCRCWAEPATGPEAAEREYKGPADDLYYETIRSGTTRGSFDPKSRGGIWSRIAFGDMSPELQAEAEKGLSAIDYVFDFSNKSIKKPISISKLSTTADNESLMGFYSNKSAAVVLNSDSEYAATTMIHEFGHWLDMKVINDKQFRTEFNDAIVNTAMYKRIAKKMISEEDKIYLLSEAELFSRCFEQYITDNAFDVTLKDQMSRIKTVMRDYYLFDIDKDMIYDLFDELFIRIGLKK